MVGEFILGSGDFLNGGVIFYFYTLLVVLIGEVMLGGGDILGGGIISSCRNILGGEDILGGGVVLCSGSI